ncbi:MAG: DUF167 domain-containing protein [Candidatus Micrarchaeota archaeon]
MLLEVKVVPDSLEFRIEKRGGEWKVFLTEPAERNRANTELVKEMEKITHRRVRILRGGKGRKKVLEIEGEEKEIHKLLADAART